MMNDLPRSLPRSALQVPARHGRPSVDFGRKVYCLFGLVFDDIGLDDATAHLRHCVRTGERCFLSTPNLNFAIAAQSDAKFRDSVQHSDLSVIDGMTILRIGRRLGLPMRERVAGSDLFERLQQTPPHGEPPIKVYFFGGPPGVAEQASRQLNAQGGGVVSVGFDSPGFGSVADMSSEATIARINDSGAEFVVVALGAKKGQAWIEHNRDRLKAPLVSHLGAVINFVAGGVKRAPKWVQDAGFEWLWRIKEEPALWKRYAADALALGRFLVTEALPSIWNGWRAGRVPAQPGTFDIRGSSTLVTLRLRGQITEAALPPIRQAVAEAAQSGATVQFDLREATQVDSAFLGLTLLLDSWQVTPRAVVQGSVTSERVLSAFTRFGARSLLGH